MAKDEPKEEKPEAKETPKAEKKEAKAPPKPEPARKVITKATGEFNTGRREGVAYTHNRKSGQR